MTYTPATWYRTNKAFIPSDIYIHTQFPPASTGIKQFQVYPNITNEYKIKDITFKEYLFSRHLITI